MSWKKILPILCCVIGELLLQTILRNSLGPFFTPIAHTLFAAGSGIGLLILGWGFKGDITAAIPRQGKRLPLYGWLCLLLLPFVWWGWSTLQHYFAEVRIDMNDPDASGSDVIPALMFYVTRFVDGVFPYIPIHGTHWQHTVIPNYLPMQWLPYTLAEWLHMDYRWIPVLALLGIMIAYYFTLFRVRPAKGLFAILFSLPVLLFFLYIKENKVDLQVTVEGLMAAFYLLVGFALIRGKLKWIAVAVTLCLLSRFSLVLWLPLFLLIILASRGFKTALFFGLALCAGFLLIYGPFLLKDPYIFTNGFDYYTYAAGGEWTIKPWQEGEQARYPYHLDKGMGFAAYFYRYASGDYLQKLEVARQAHLIGSLAATALLAAFYWPNRKKIHPMIFALASLKIYLAVFYSLIQVPYFYLYTVPLLLNLPLMWMAAKLIQQKDKPQPTHN